MNIQAEKFKVKNRDEDNMYIIRKYILTFCYLVYICTDVLAANPTFIPNQLNQCKITEAASNNYEPDKFGQTNNLLRNTGQNPIFCGEKIIVKGRVLDKNCVPISDAKIYLWQVGCDGKYPYRPLRNRVDTDLLNLHNGSTFTGSGIATSNNNGEFLFITIAPPNLKSEKAHLNFYIEHYSLGNLQTKFYLSNTNLLTNNAENWYSDAEQVKTYKIDIVMPSEGTKRY